MPGTLLSPVLIGRAHELEVLDRVLHEAQNGAGSCVLLSGEAGIGKSRLAAELSKHAATSGFLILQGHCSEQDRSYPYAPWVDALRTLLATPDAVKINPLTETFAPELVKLLPELALLLPAIQPTAPLDPAAEKHRLLETLTRFFTALTADRPVLIVLEDLHWSDEQSLEFLQFFLRRITAAPILVLGTYRSEDANPRFAYHLLELNREHLVDELQLAPLARAEVAQMAQAILPTRQPMRSDWLDQLMALTEGNPFFVEEMLKTLEPNDAPPGKVDQLPIPRSLQQTIQRRVEGLPEATRYVLSLASVIGERFGFDLLQAISGEDETALLPRLKALLAAQLIVEQSADQFAFRHALTREVVHATLLFRERRAMHQTIGETLERFTGTPVEAPAASLAYHFYQGGEWQKALAYAQRAGHEAQALYAPREALVHFNHALDAAQQLGIAPQLSTLRGRAQAYEVLGEFDRARADFEAALELASQGTDRLDEWQALIDLGFLWQSRNLERAGEYYQRALELARTIEDPSVLAQTLNRVGNWHFNRGQPREALPYHREALALFQLENDRHGMAHTLDLLGIVSYQLGAVVQGTEYLEQAVPILRALDDRQALVNTLANLTMRALTNTEVLGEINYLQLVELSDEALQIARRFYWYQGEVLALMQGAISLERAGAYGQALGRLAQAQSIAEEGRNRESFGRLHLIYGQVFTGLMALDEAKQHSKQLWHTCKSSAPGCSCSALNHNSRTSLSYKVILPAPMRC